MTDIRQLQQTWDLLARQDPLWAICTDPERKNGNWDSAAFFATGEMEVATVMEYLRGINVKLNTRGPALDFGCGVGRLTQALATRFELCVGVDISSTMVQLAEQYNQFPQKCRYVVNEAEDLQLFEDASFTFVYCSIVLQHMQPWYALAYIREFVRVLGPGGVAVFQVPDFQKSLRERLGIRTRIKRLLGIAPPPSVPFSAPIGTMEMHWTPEAEVRAAVKSGGAGLRSVGYTNSVDPDFNGRLLYLRSRPDRGMVSKQYCAVKWETGRPPTASAGRTAMHRPRC